MLTIDETLSIRQAIRDINIRLIVYQGFQIIYFFWDAATVIETQHHFIQQSFKMRMILESSLDIVTKIGNKRQYGFTGCNCV